MTAANGDGSRRRSGLLTVEELRAEVEAGRIDTVLIAMADMQGRLQGKRLAATHFLEDVLEHDAEGCNYLLAVDVDMNTVSGYAMSSWDRGYGDFVFKPDLATLRRVPWQEGTALVMCDLEWEDGSPVLASPRGVLRRQLERLAERGWLALAGTELEFIVFRDSYEDAWGKGYRDLQPANDYNVDYSLLGTARIEPLLRRIRNSMAGAGLRVESAKGECNYGQHEIAFRYADALTTADGHVIYKNGAKEIAAQDGCSLTFMSKYNEREGNSCHIHFSLRGADGGEAIMAAPQGSGEPRRGAPVSQAARHHGYSELMEQFLAGQLACLRELTLFLAPNINSYKRYAAGSFAPTAVAWGHDNRTCALRVVGHGHSLRLENRVPGGDVNPYLALAAIIAAGLHGVDKGLPLEDEFTGNAYVADKPTVPRTLREARDLFADSEVVRQAFGADVVDHYTNMARVELDAFDAAVTDWERYRGFERL
jgi:glutamine synthetase